MRSGSRLAILVLFILIHFYATAQDLEIKGKITDASSNLPLSGASVVLADDSTLGTSSDTNGQFQLTVSYGDTIIVTYVGYAEVKLRVATERFLSITLQPEQYNLNEVVIGSYQGRKKLLSSTGPVTLITPKDLYLRNEPIITSLLNRIPGVYMHSGALNTNRITIRGIGARSPFSTRDIRAYLNDIPLTNGEGETSIEDIDLSFIGQSEVLRGPASTLYGAGLGGVINLRTEKSPFNRSSINLTSKVGSYGLFQNSLSFQTSNSKQNTAINVNDTHSDGYRENNTYNRSGAFINSSIAFSDKHVLNILFNYIYLKAFIPSSLDSVDFVNNPRSAAFVWQQAEGFEEYDKILSGISLSSEISNRLSNTSSIYAGYQDQYERRFFNILEDRSIFGGIRTYFNLRVREEDQFTLGAEVFNEEYDWKTFENDNLSKGDPLSDNEEIRFYTNVFIQYQARFGEKIKIDAGLNFNYTRYNFRLLQITDTTLTTGTKRFDSVISPRVAFNYRTSQKNALYFTINHGFTTPALQESLLDDGSVNTGLSNETGWNFEVGGRGDVGKLFYDVSIFYMRVRDLLVSRQTPSDMVISVNAGSSNHQGLELNLRYATQFNQNWPSSLTIWSTYAWMNYKFDEFVDGDDDFSGNDLTGVPRHMLNIGMEADSKPGLYSQLTYQFVSEIPINDTNSVFSKDYLLLNLILGWKRSFGVFLIDIRGGVNNLLNEKYASMLAINARGFGGNLPRYYYPGLPINYFADLRLSYFFR